MLAADVARCAGYQADGEWREGCEDCRRRTTPPADPERVWMMTPPVLVVFECEARIPPAYEIPAHHLAAPRPAPIAFPEVAGVHASDCAEADAPGEPLAPVLADPSSTQKGDEL